LSPETSEETLKSFFSQCGEVLKVKVLKDRSSRPYAFVQFTAVDSANLALKNSNGKVLEGRRLRIEKAKVNRTLFLAKLNKSFNSQKLREICEEHGAVENVTIIKNHLTNKSKGCGFVKFAYREDAMEAFMALKNTHRKWVIEWATSTNDPDSLGIDKCNVFVGGLNPNQVSKELLEDRFGKYGQLESVTLINREDINNDAHLMNEAPGSEEDRPPRNAFAFLRFVHPMSSSSAIEQENGAEWLDRKIKVQYCESPEMKNKRRQNKFLNSVTQFNQFYRQGVQLPNTQMMMPQFQAPTGLPMYGMPSASPTAPTNNTGLNNSKFNPYLRKADVYASTFAYPVNPMIAYTNQPWLYSQLQTQQAQQGLPLQHPSHLSHHPSSFNSNGSHRSERENNNNANGLSDSLAAMSLSNQPRNPW
jgi:RNA recognition motif-containing protein